MSNSDSRISLLSGQALLTAVKGSLIGSFDLSSLCFTSVVTDSRNVTPGSLFVPLIGENQDGHKYIPQALEKGASVVFVARSSYESDCEGYEKLAVMHGDVAFISVSHTMHALQDAAACYVAGFPHLVRCAVTGSSGKTTTKELAASILRQKYSVITNKGNLNSETGLPLSVFQIRPEHTLGLFEMGMNRVNEIGEIAAVLKPDYGIVTNIGTAHIGILGSREAIAAEKKKIFRYMNASGTAKDAVAVIPADDDFADFLADGVNGRVVRYGTDPLSCAALGVVFISDDGVEGTTFSVDGVRMHLSLPGTYNYKNALGAIALARELGVSPEQIKAGIEAVGTLDGRSRIRKGTYTVLEDCYNANPDSMEKALDFSADVNVHEPCKKVLVLGDMLELGAESRACHAAVGRLAAEINADIVVFIGKEMAAAYEEAKKTVSGASFIYEAERNDEAVCRVAERIKDAAPAGSFVLLKASRGMAFERFIPLLLPEEVQA
ncbi:MAG: UDP-N-acetylmuramoyl-tripeptide--D-alanyl-D-alanine ligase [Treponema sp.]|nr:UDP-N-acetylmuramoyl-tripeptide--D-alanyl-D-alanine ligase [Treponema sp.]